MGRWGNEKRGRKRAASSGAKAGLATERGRALAISPAAVPQQPGETLEFAARGPPLDASDLIPGPVLRRKLGISAVTLWRWRHDKASGFPAAKVIRGRLYFPSGEVTAWLARQPEAA
jgi:predicted DNA-binding transcriptional regulator AlpA